MGRKTKIDALKVVGKSDFWNKGKEFIYSENMVTGNIDVTQMALKINSDCGKPKQKRKIVQMVRNYT
jgi:hypothetical protein